MEPMTMAALAQMALGGTQTLASLMTRVPDRPMYQPSQATQEAEKIARTEANSSLMPGHGEHAARINQNAASALHSATSNMTSSSDIMNYGGAINAQANRSLSDLVRLNLQDKARRRAVHLGTLGQLAQEQNMAWQDKKQAYDDIVDVRAGLMRAGITTGFDAISGLAAQAQYRQGQPQQPVSLPSAPQAQNYSLSEMANMDANESWLRLQERMRSGLNQ